MKAYAARTKDRDLLMKSSSGGVFTELAKVVLSRQGVVYGCVWKHPEMVAVHVRAERESELEPMRGSKYVPSDISLAVTQIPEDLAQDRKVLFTGTPCQVAAVRKRVESEVALKPFRSNLFLVEIICHGVPEPEVWEEYKRQLGKPIVDIRFKDKRTGWKNPTMVVSFADGSFQESTLYSNPFVRAYMSGLAMREGCFRCPFKAGNSGADLTIGDFWGVGKHVPAWRDDLGVSAVVVWNDQGSWLFDKCDSALGIQIVCCGSITASNPNLSSPHRPHPGRMRFLSCYRNTSVQDWGDHVSSRMTIGQFVKRLMNYLTHKHFVNKEGRK